MAETRPARPTSKVRYWRKAKADKLLPLPDEVGCQILLTTGKHIGPCRGTCRDG